MFGLIAQMGISMEIALISRFKLNSGMSQNSAPHIVIELTKNYLRKLNDTELMDHFIKFSNKFADALKESAIEDLNMMQSYLRLITSEMSLRSTRR
jgi:hypothetical protein